MFIIPSFVITAHFCIPEFRLQEFAHQKHLHNFMAQPTESADILAAEQKKKEAKNKAREDRKKADAEKKRKEAEEEAIKLRNTQLKLANSIRYKEPSNKRQLLSRAKTVSSTRSGQSHQAQKSFGKPDRDPCLLGFKVTSNRIMTGRVPIQEMAPVSNVDQPAAAASDVASVSSDATASVSSSTASENISFFIGHVLIRVPSSSVETKTNDEDMNNNAEAAAASVSTSTASENISFFIGHVPIRIPSVETKTNDEDMNNNSEAATVPGTTIVTATLSVEKINDLVNAVAETNRFANAIDMKEIPLVYEANTSMNHAKSNGDDNFEARGNEVIREEEQNESKNSNDAAEHKFEAGQNELLEESKYEEENMEARRVEPSATTTAEKPHGSGSNAQSESEKRDADAKRVEEVAIARKTRHKKKRKAMETASTSEEKLHKSESDGQSVSEKEQDVEAKRVEEAASKSEEEPDESWFDAGSSWEEEQVLEDKRVEETATARKKREKRKKKKKSKADKHKLDGSYPSIGVLSLALVCILINMFYR